ncbi:hypothetical protein D3C77_644640 [compost metagenome]
MCIRNMVEEEQQLIRARVKAVIQLGIGAGILMRIPRPCRLCAIYADAVTIGKMVSPPFGVFVAVHVRAVMVMRYNHPAHAERRRIVLIGRPGFHENA